VSSLRRPTARPQPSASLLPPRRSGDLFLTALRRRARTAAPAPRSRSRAQQQLAAAAAAVGSPPVQRRAAAPTPAPRPTAATPPPRQSPRPPAPPAAPELPPRLAALYRLYGGLRHAAQLLRSRSLPLTLAALSGPACRLSGVTCGESQVAQLALASSDERARRGTDSGAPPPLLCLSWQRVPKSGGAGGTEEALVLALPPSKPGSSDPSERLLAVEKQNDMLHFALQE
jgi:hypothetical protein